MSAPKLLYIEYCAMQKFWRENSIYDMRWADHTLGTFLKMLFFSVRLLDFRFLCIFRHQLISSILLSVVNKLKQHSGATTLCIVII
jgi:hypothetical protein